MELLHTRAVYPLGELEMISPWFDNRKLMDGGPDLVSRAPRLLLIVAPPRSGSYLLCRQLWELGYGRPFEYCNPNPLFRTALARFGRRPWQQLIRARSASPAFDAQTFFSCKLQPYQMRGSLEHQIQQMWIPLARRGWLENNQGRLRLELVFLRRLDVLRSAASWHFSLCTGAFDQGLTYTFQRWPMGALLDPEYLNKSLVEYREHLRWLRQAQAAFPLAHRLTHEELLADQM
ncbi:MAG: Stf0 sulfotransferase [Cyanobacteriota bacterium]